jgi:hypothetical protein
VSGVLSVLSLIVAVLALLVAALDYRRQGDLGRQQATLQERVTAIEEARREEERRLRRQASVEARFYKQRVDGAPFDPKFWVDLRNEGLAPACDVTISVANAEKHLRPGVTVDPKALPIPWLHPGQGVSIELDLIPGAPPPPDMVVAWVDGEGAQERPVRATWL